jgi:hypothetical protein
VDVRRSVKVGDLVELQSPVLHVSGFLKPGIVGIVIVIDEPQIIFDDESLATAQVIFGNEKVGCHRRELEIINESR